jgi:hypothetical protein
MKIKLTLYRDMITTESASQWEYDKDHEAAGMVSEKKCTIDEAVKEINENFGYLYDTDCHDGRGSIVYPEFGVWSYSEGSEYRELYIAEGEPEIVELLMQRLEESRIAFDEATKQRRS